VLSACYVNGDLVSGQKDGSLYVWKGRNVEKALRKHKGPVNAIYSIGGAKLCEVLIFCTEIVLTVY
jgi:hypothetical protein